eukprot:1488676-Ditylum_brightwellii.AAC.1
MTALTNASVTNVARQDILQRTVGTEKGMCTKGLLDMCQRRTGKKAASNKILVASVAVGVYSSATQMALPFEDANKTGKAIGSSDALFEDANETDKAIR